MIKPAILFLSRPRLDDMIIEAVSILKNNFRIIVMCNHDNIERYQKIDGIAVEMFLEKDELIRKKVSNNLNEKASNIEKELGLNCYEANLNYLLYKRYVLSHYHLKKGDYWENDYTVEHFVAAYEKLTTIIEKYGITYAFFETIDLIETFILNALDKEGRIVTLYFHWNALGDELRINLARGIGKHNPKLDIIYQNNLITAQAFAKAQMLIDEARQEIVTSEYDRIHKQSIWTKYSLTQLIQKIGIANFRFLYRRWVAKKYFSREIPQNYIAFFLQHTPEASIFVPATLWHNQQNLIEQLAVTAKSGYQIVVKEHPKTYGRRPLSFYRELATFPNIILVGPEQDGKTIARNAKAVVNLTGSLGFDALLHGTKVFALVDSYITTCESVKQIETPKQVWDYIDDEFFSYEDVLKLIAARYDSSYVFPKGEGGTLWPKYGAGNVLASALIDNINALNSTAQKASN